VSFQGDARFEEASFQGRADFSWANFQGRADFGQTNFQGEAVFSKASFQDVVRFNEAKFNSLARFGMASFQSDVWLDSVTFRDRAVFDMARFHGDARFRDARFQGDASFTRASFQRVAKLPRARFQGNAWFARVSFQGDVWFNQVRIQGHAQFGEASFERPVGLGPVVVGGTLSLDRIVFTEPVQVAATAAELSCRGSRFRAGGQLGIADAEITLEDAEVPAPLILARAVPGELVGQGAAVPAEDSARPPVPALRRPLVVSGQRADVAKLALTDLDLRPCRFVGAHHLDQLTVNSADAFHRAPARLGHGRQVLAEECAWRRQRSRRAARRWPSFPPLPSSPPPTPGELVGVYRQLRKGREDAKNEPGAADFYYGECEMRRHAADTPWAEKAILTAYWLLLGYGLRAGRALLTLLAAVATVGY
jgi:Pentapeptide repeats (9 copies)